MSEWGRVDGEGTVYVRTSDGERAVGSWKAGAPGEGLAHFVRRFEQLATEVSLLEQRLANGVGDPTHLLTSARRLMETLPTAAAVGNLSALLARVTVLVERAEAAVEQTRTARAAERVLAVEAKTALAAEAEQLAGSSDWKAAGERLRSLGEDWKKIHGVDRRTDEELWGRVAAARSRFGERRSAHFAALELQRGVSQERKEKLIADAEKLTGSTDWKGGAEAFKSLMASWKAAGRAPREVEDALWGRFKAAQDAFFTARNAVFAGKDEELRGNQTVKEAILAEAEALDLSAGLETARRRMRELQQRWEAAGKVPREVMRSLEDRMGAVEAKVRSAGENAPSRVSESPFTVRLREKVQELEEKVARARAAGRETAELEAALATQRDWLRQAGGAAPAGPAAAATSGPPASDAAGGSEVKAKAKAARSTTAWVRATDS